MKTRNYYAVMLLLSIITWSCSNNDLNQGSLKSSLNTSVQELTSAVNHISTSDGYQVLSVTSTSSNGPSHVKSSLAAYDSTYKSILLKDIAGIYDFKATNIKGPLSALKIFTKTGTSDLMIVRLPESKVKHPNSLIIYNPSDTLLKNDYILSLSKYQDYFINSYTYDYSMATNINIKNVDAGTLAIQSSSSIAKGYKYASEFVFADGYKAACTYASGDTAVANYSISQGSKILYAEKYTAVRGSKEQRHSERRYSLTIGNVEIVREMGKGGLDSAKVYLGGVLQVKSKIEIVDSSTNSTDGTENSLISKKRELKITFDDGTSSTISELLGTSVSNIRSLFASLRQSTFAVSIIDWIAWNVYINK
jgi:hypothetical protein